MFSSLGLEFIALVGAAAIFGLLKWRMMSKEKALREGVESHEVQGIGR
jgi:hypothetical protein